MFIIFCRRQLLKRLGEEAKKIKSMENESINSEISETTYSRMDSEYRTQMCLDVISKSKGMYANVQYCEDDNTFVIDNKGLDKNDPRT